MGGAISQLAEMESLASTLFVQSGVGSRVDAVKVPTVIWIADTVKSFFYY